MRCLKRGRYKYLLLVTLFMASVWTFFTSTLTNTQPSQDVYSLIYNTNLTHIISKSVNSSVTMATRNHTVVTNLDRASQGTSANVPAQTWSIKMEDKPMWMDAINLAGKLRPKAGTLTIGIPTVYRPHASYLHTTLRSLITNMTPQERGEVLCVIFLSASNSTYASQLASNLTLAFPEHINSGFIRLITAPQAYYPSMDNLKITFNDKMDRVKWRSKQNLDYAFLMNYAQNLSTYYLQIEDDVLAASQFVRKIFEFIEKQRKSWAVLDFSGRGFIGKLFKSSDLPKLALILRVFFNEQPCDFLINYFSGLLLQTKHIIRKPSLFQHIGHYSSLKDQIRKIGEGAFSNNPDAALGTTLETYGSYSLDKLYNGVTKFWGKTPKIGDTIDIRFVDPQNSIKRINIQTGDLNIPRKDTVQGAVLEYSKGPAKTCSVYKLMATFQYGKVELNSTGIKPIKCLRIRITANQTEWLMIRKLQFLT